MSTTLTLNPAYQLYERKGQAYCDSLQIAETFEKRHDNVLADIKSLDCSDAFRLLNFQESTYRNEQNKRQPSYLMTKDGFTFLVMGYRGKKAAAFKEAYIRRFNQMESFLRNLAAARQECPELTDAIKAAHDELKPYHITNELNMLNAIVTGKTAKQLREAYGLEHGESVRPHLAPERLTALMLLRRMDTGLVLAVPDYQERKRILTAYFNALRQPALSA